jgi:hypothetical protein
MHKTADEVKAEYVGVLGAHAGPFFYFLKNELILLHAKWKQYVVLFGTSESRIDVLNSMAGFFFGTVQDVMWDDALLHIARLTDPAKTFGKANKANLSVQGLVDLMAGTPIHQDIERLVQDAVTAAGFAREWRNKGLAHRDLATVLSQGSTQISRGSQQQVEHALAALRAALNRIDEHYLRIDPTCSFELLAAGDVDVFLYYLRLARDARDARERRLLEGRPSHEDLSLPRAI